MNPASVLLVQAGLQGVAVPLTAAALGGLVGAAMWFGRRNLLVLSVLGTLAAYGVLGLMEVAPVLQGLHFGAHLMIAVFALLALRIGLQTALLHEEPDLVNPNGLVLCPHCDHVVPDMVFCPNCGVASRAASRTSRTARRAGVSDGVAATRPGYAVPAGSYEAAPVRHTTHRWLFTTMGAGVVVAVAVGLTAAVLATPLKPKYTCPPDCGRPPIGQPIESDPHSSPPTGSSRSVPGPRIGVSGDAESDGVGLNFPAGDTGTMQTVRATGRKGHTRNRFSMA